MVRVKGGKGRHVIYIYIYIYIYKDVNVYVDM